jgi:hypothetical protein
MFWVRQHRESWSVMLFGSATLRILVNCGLPVLPCTGGRRVRLTHGFAAAHPSPTRLAILLRSRTCHYFSVGALATVLLAHVSAFGRFDEILAAAL